MTTVFTNGCFDIIHRGHVEMLLAARSLGDRLVVGLNSDASVRQLKGPDRPVNCQADREAVLRALMCVSDVVVFEGQRCADAIRAVRPQVYVKAGDYSLATLDPSERGALEECGAEIVFVPYHYGLSTTRTLEKLNAA